MAEMSPFLQLALALAIIILAAKVGGYLSFRLGQPTVLGELMTGILLGPSVIDLLNLPFFDGAHLGETVHELAEIGVMLLMFIAGLELHLEDLLHSRKVASLAGSLGVLLPLGLWVGVGLLIGQSLEPALFVGLILAATSVSISAQTLMELGVLRSRVGISLLGAAVFDDILVVLGLSIFVALTQGGPGGWGSIALIVFWMAAYLALATVFGLYVMPRLARTVERLPISRGLVSFAFVSILLYGWLAEVMGSMAAITGAFLAGLWLARSPQKERIEQGIGALAYGVFVPVFFVNVGLTTNIRELTGDGLWLVLVMTLVAVLGKVLGSGGGALMAGFSRLEGLQLGVGMMSRGEVGLIVASLGLTYNIIQQDTFSAVVGVVILTTLMTPPLLRLLFTRKTKIPVKIYKEE